MTLKINQVIFSNFVKLDNFQINFSLKVCFSRGLFQNFQQRKFLKLICEPWEEYFSENYQVSKNLRKLDTWIKICEVFLVLGKYKYRTILRRLKKKSTFKIFGKSLSWLFHLLFKLFPSTAVLLQIVTWVCITSWLYSPLMSTSSPAHLFAIFLKMLWGRGYFIKEAWTTLNLAW